MIARSAARIFNEACALLEDLLGDETRRHIMAALDRRDPAATLKTAMRAHRFLAGKRMVALAGVIDALDAATRADGFHVLHTWDPAARRFREDPTAALLLGYVRRSLRGGELDSHALVLDAYFLLLLTLLATRVWDAEDPDHALGRITELVRLLQGPTGSGRQFVDDAPTLLNLAIAQYQPDERGFDELLVRIRTLDQRHQVAIAMVAAPNFGAHLRWGRRFMYGEDAERMRSDNVVDYPWVMYAAATLMGEFERLGADPAADRGRVAGALLNVMSADVEALVGEHAPSVLANHALERAQFRAAVVRHRGALAALCRVQLPTDQRFSPLALHFNFLHNVLTAGLAVTIEDGTPNLSLNHLLVAGAGGARLSESPDVLAHQLALYADQPARHGARSAPLIWHDTAWGSACASHALTVIEGLA